MKEEYIKEVSKMLHLSRSKKMDVLRDLEEIFRSAEDADETEQQVIERLGLPYEFAQDIESQLGVDRANSKRTPNTIILILSAVIGVLSLTMYGTIHNQEYPKNAIGQANAMTSISIAGPLSLNLPLIFLVLGIFFIAVAVIMAVLLLRGRKKK